MDFRNTTPPTGGHSGTRLYLHIGTEKTGTTTIQSFLARNREVLKQSGIAYPKSPGGSNHLKLNAYALDDTKRDDTSKRFGIKSLEHLYRFRNDFRTEFSEEISQLSSQASKFILSNEHCSARLTAEEEVERLHGLLDPLFDNIRVVIYLREQGENLHSSYSTNMRTGHARYPDFDTINWQKYDYKRRVDRWATVFGKQNVNVRVYSSQCFVSESLLIDFLDAVHQPWQSEFIEPPRKNTGLDARALEFLRLFNERSSGILDDSDLPAVRRSVVQALEALSTGPSLSFPEDKVRWLRDQCAPINRRIATEYFNREELFPPSTISDQSGSVPHRPLSAEQVMETLIRLLARQHHGEEPRR